MDTRSDHSTSSSSSSSSSSNTHLNNTSSDSILLSRYSHLSVEERITAAEELIKKDDYSSAVTLLYYTLTETVEKNGEKSLAAAPVYYAYGDALLTQYISESSVLGKDTGNKGEEEGDEEENDGEEEGGGDGDAMDQDGQEKRHEPATAISASIDSKSETENKSNNNNNNSDNSTGNTDILDENDDLQTAWFNLEFSRLIYSEHFPLTNRSTDVNENDINALSDEQKKYGLALAKTLVRLADANMENEKFEEAYTEYEKSLLYHQWFLPPYDAEIASAHFQLAVCALMLNETKKALYHYQTLAAIYNMKIAKQYNSMINIIKEGYIELPQSCFSTNSSKEESSSYQLLPLYSRFLSSDITLSQSDSILSPSIRFSLDKLKQIEKNQSDINASKEILSEIAERIIDVQEQIKTWQDPKKLIKDQLSEMMGSIGTLFGSMTGGKGAATAQEKTESSSSSSLLSSFSYNNLPSSTSSFSSNTPFGFPSSSSSSSNGASSSSINIVGVKRRSPSSSSSSSSSEENSSSVNGESNITPVNILAPRKKVKADDNNNALNGVSSSSS